jgi:hypothetical protein
MTFHVKHRGTLCTKCGANPRVQGQRWCLDCRALYQREVYRPRERKRIKALEEANFAKEMQRIRRSVERAT